MISKEKLQQFAAVVRTRYPDFGIKPLPNDQVGALLSEKVLKYYQDSFGRVMGDQHIATALKSYELPFISKTFGPLPNIFYVPRSTPGVTPPANFSSPISLPRLTTAQMLPAAAVPPQRTLPTLDHVAQSTLADCCGLGAFRTLGHLGGINYCIPSWDDVQRAIFAIWLNDNVAPKFGAIIATSATQSSANAWLPWEDFMLEAGFQPLSRWQNPKYPPESANWITVWHLSLVEDFLPKTKNAPNNSASAAQATTPPARVVGARRLSSKGLRKSAIL